MIPKVEFILPDKREHIENISGFLNPTFGWDWSEQILKEFISISKKKRIKKIGLGVRINNIKAIKFYKKMGFKIAHYEVEKLL